MNDDAELHGELINKKVAMKTLGIKTSRFHKLINENKVETIRRSINRKNVFFRLYDIQRLKEKLDETLIVR